jgi:glycosyltransferase involved in cell wall biosynthesis
VKVAIVGPVYPYRAGIAYCTTRLAKELGADVISFRRQYPKRFYPGGDDIDPTLPRFDADFSLDILNPLTWLRARRKLRAYDAVIFVWWIWVWALPYLVMMRRSQRVILQCHNIGEKEPAWWKRALANFVFRRADVLVVHARTEMEDAQRRAPARIVRTFLPVHELGGVMPPRDEARTVLGVSGNVALFFGHVRPFKALDVVLRAWPKLRTPVTLLVAGEAWWDSAEQYRKLANEHVVFHFRFVPDSEIATYFAAADVVLAPYRTEAQSGVALTAFHFGRPVIASNVGGLPEVVRDGENGFVIPPDDDDALAFAIDRFYASDRATMERRAADSAGQYSWKEYGNVFKDLLSA